MSKNIVKKSDTENLPAEADLLQAMIEDAGEGTEAIRASDITTPFLRIIQALSPELDSRKSAYVEGAKKGDIINTATREIFKEAVVLPCYYQAQYVEWKPRTAGGGLVAIHLNKDVLAGTVRNEKNQDINAAGNEIVLTGMFYCLLIRDEETLDFETVAIPMQKTQFKKAKQWNAIIMNNKGRAPSGDIFVKPIFSQAFKLKTIQEQNARGEAYENWTVEKYKNIQELKNGATFYQAAKLFGQVAKDGGVKTESLDNGEDIESGIDTSSVM